MNKLTEQRRTGAWGSLLVLVTVALLTSVQARSDMLTVSAQANIFGAGHAVPPAPGGGGGGVLPSAVSFTPDSNLVLTFSSVTGSVSCCSGGGGTFNAPDGGLLASGTTDITSFNGIAGIIHTNRTMFLVGVFLDNTEPSDPAPARLSFSDPEDFTDLSPALGQVFFIGDGLTDTGGTVQRFHVPAGATRLFLGFADAINFGNPTSPPGFYSDNVGSLTAEFSLGPTMPDHFLGYKIKPTKGATEVFTPPSPVTLTDPSNMSAVFDVKRPELLYPPANKNGEGVADEDTHLEAYSLKLTKTDPPQPKPPGRKNVHLQNQFGDIVVDVGRPNRLLVPTAKNLTGPADLPGPNSMDHYRCNTVKIPKGTTFTPILGVLIDDQFIDDPGKKFDLKKLLRLCTPVKKNDEALINNPDTHLLCYQAKVSENEPKHEPRKGVHLHNQFGQEQIDTVREAEFCVPTTEVGPGTLTGSDTDETEVEE
jgi:hypothetical protein